MYEEIKPLPDKEYQILRDELKRVCDKKRNRIFAGVWNNDRSGSPSRLSSLGMTMLT
jgi:hypothetical protein